VNVVLSAVLLATAPAPSTSLRAAEPLQEAAHAIEAERLAQAELLIARAIQAGASGPAVDRLLADLAFASGDYARALAGYERVLARDVRSYLILERAGLSALHIQEADRAVRYLELAARDPGATWRVWNGRGVLADGRADWEAAHAAYAKAAELAPASAEIANNRGWSCFLQERWQESVEHLERAHRLDPKSKRIFDNLLLARAAISDDLPQRRQGEGDAEFAARLNDAGVVAQLQQQHHKAVAAFARAVTARTRWFERAANNLERAEKLK
jgi:Flp pilus assembly protein TadD